uniref:Uncharacterized protein n=1 Tax=Zea mays TaxID=4577 RepID=C4JA46_MAIZE|nr:unknown [Zea mays]
MDVVVNSFPGLHGEAVGFRAGEGGAAGGRDARDDAGDGHARVRGARVHPDGPPDGEERRVQLRRGAAGAAHGPPLRRQEPARARAEPRGLGAPLPPPRRPPAPLHGPGAGDAVLGARRGEGRRGGAPVPAERAQGAPHHATRRRRARAAAGARRRRAHGPVRVHGRWSRRRGRGRAGAGRCRRRRQCGRGGGRQAGQEARHVGRPRGEPTAEPVRQRREETREPADPEQGMSAIANLQVYIAR